MKKKIAFVNKALWYGGIETSLITLLDRITFRVSVTGSSSCLPVHDTIQESKGRVAAASSDNLKILFINTIMQIKV